MSVARYIGSAARLANGQVLVAGGWSYTTDYDPSLATVEIYDPASNSWTASGSMSIGRARFALVSLADGRLLAAGGVAAIEQKNITKAKLLYDVLDHSTFYSSAVAPADRSRMNVTWRLPDEALEAAFLKGAQARGMVQLKGHRAVGGVRASIYNAMPVEGVAALAEYMREFEQNRG